MSHVSAFVAGLRNWRTTVLGVISGLLIVLHALQAFLDDDPATVPDWGAAIEAISGIVLAVALLFTRDANVTSEESGAK